MNLIFASRWLMQPSENWVLASQFIPDEGNIDRAWPFDIIPRVIDWNQWKRTEQGLKQRLKH